MNKAYTLDTIKGSVSIIAPNTAAALKIKARIKRALKLEESQVTLIEETELNRALRIKRGA